MKEQTLTKGEMKKKLISETAIRLFRQKGYDHVTVDEIIEACHTSKGSFYYHFSSKADIFYDKFSEADNYYNAVYESFDPSMCPLTKLRQFIEAMYRFLNDHMGKELIRIVYGSSLQSTEHLFFRNRERALFTITDRIMEEWLRTSSSPHSKEALTNAIIQCVMGTIYFWATYDENGSLIEEGRTSLDLLIRSLRHDT